MKKQNYETKKLILCAILVACSIVLNQVKIIHMPLGGSVTLFSMLAATLAGYFCGPKYGLMSGFVLGLLNLAFGGYVVHWAQLLLDYIIAFTCLGLSGFFKDFKNGLYTGYIVSVLGRFISSFLSGWIFFGSYAPEGTAPWLYSLIYQGSYLGVEAAITLVVLAIPVVHNTIYKLKKEV